MRINTARGPVEIGEPTWDELLALAGGRKLNPKAYEVLVAVFMAGAKAMRDELERGRGARLEAALLGKDLGPEN